MENLPNRIIKFDDFQINLNERQLYRHGESVAIPPKVFDTLLVLVENSGRLLEKDFLMNRIWPETFVEESSLTQYIFQLRKALGEDGNGIRYIETVPKRGYRFLAQPVTEEIEKSSASNHRASLDQTIEELIQVSDRSSPFSYPYPVIPEPPDQFIETKARKFGLSKKIVSALSFFLLLTLAGYFFLKAMGTRTVTARAGQITKLTTNGKTNNPAISPDGKYIAYVLDEGGQQSLWVRQIAATSVVQVVAKSDVDYIGLSFSPDGNYLYYAAYQNPKVIAVLYRVPILGGTPTKILEDIDSAITFSPDGKQFAFIRNDLEKLDNSLILANADGKHETILATHKFPYAFSVEGPSWSPDGKIIASAMRGVDAGKPFMTVVGVKVADHQEMQLTSKRWSRIGQVAWRTDNSGIIAIARPHESPILANQIWYLPYPIDEPHRITNDLANYTGLSLSTASNQLVAIQSTKASHFYIAPDGDATKAAPLPSIGIDNFSENMGLNWISDGKLIFGSFANGNTDLWTADLSNNRLTQLTVTNSDELQPAVSADGNFIVFLSDRAGSFNIWKMNADGSNEIQLTNGSGEYSPGFTADGKWVVYSGMLNEMFVLWKVPAEGGKPVQLTTETSSRPVLSPDGQKVAHLRLDQKSFQMKLAVMPVEGHESPQVFNTSIAEPHLINWSPDGKMITYIDTKNGVSNIWGQPLDGTAPKKLTDFKTDQIFRFAWSKDGKSLACERGFYLNDVVLITDFS